MINTQDELYAWLPCTDDNLYVLDFAWRNYTHVYKAPSNDSPKYILIIYSFDEKINMVSFKKVGKQPPYKQLNCQDFEALLLLPEQVGIEYLKALITD